MCFLAEFDEGHTFSEMRGLDLETPGIASHNLIEFGDGLFILFLFVGYFTEIELRIRSEFGVAVILEVVLEFLAGEIVFAAGDVAQAIGIEGVGGRRGTARGSASRGAGIGGLTANRRAWVGDAGAWRSASAAGDFRVDALHAVLQID